MASGAEEYRPAPQIAEPTGYNFRGFGKTMRDESEEERERIRQGGGLAQQQLKQGLGAAAMQQAALARGGGPMAQRAAMMAGAQQASQGAGQAAMLREQELARAQAGVMGALQQQAGMGMAVEQMGLQAQMAQANADLKSRALDIEQEARNRQFDTGIAGAITGTLGAALPMLGGALSDPSKKVSYSKSKHTYSPGDAKRGVDRPARDTPVSDEEMDAFFAADPVDDSALERQIAIRQAFDDNRFPTPAREPRLALSPENYTPIGRAEHANPDLIRNAPIGPETREAAADMRAEQEALNVARGRQAGLGGEPDRPSVEEMQAAINEVNRNKLAQERLAGQRAIRRGAAKVGEDGPTVTANEFDVTPLADGLNSMKDGAKAAGMSKGKKGKKDEGVASALGALTEKFGEGLMKTSEAMSDSGAKQGLMTDRTLDDLDAYHYEYKPDVQRRLAVPSGHRIGPMADDLEKTPLGAAAVKETENGKVIDRDNYLFGVITPGLQRLHERLEALEKKKGRK